MSLSPWDALAEWVRDIGWRIRCRLSKRLPPMRLLKGVSDG